MFLSKILINSCIIIHGIRKTILVQFLPAFSTVEILKSHVNGCFKNNHKQMIKMPGKGKYARFNNYERKIKSPFMVCPNF